MEAISISGGRAPFGRSFVTAVDPDGAHARGVGAGDVAIEAIAHHDALLRALTPSSFIAWAKTAGSRLGEFHLTREDDRVEEMRARFSLAIFASCVSAKPFVMIAIL